MGGMDNTNGPRPVTGVKRFLASHLCEAHVEGCGRHCAILVTNDYDIERSTVQVCIYRQRKEKHAAREKKIGNGKNTGRLSPGQHTKTRELFEGSGSTREGNSLLKRRTTSHGITFRAAEQMLHATTKHNRGVMKKRKQAVQVVREPGALAPC